MHVVVNSSVLIALAKICRLEILEKLFNEIIVPETVWEEAIVEGKEGSEKIKSANFIHVRKVHDKALVNLLKNFVDNGEAEAITLAKEVGANLIILDDKDARVIAKELGLRVIGTLGILALAKTVGVITTVKPLVEELKHKGFYISQEVVEELLRKINEADNTQ